MPIQQGLRIPLAFAGLLTLGLVCVPRLCAEPAGPAGRHKVREPGVEQVAFCDYWPLALGNRWHFVHGADWGLDMEVTDLLEVNGFEVWELTTIRVTFGGLETIVEYWVFVDGWLYVTPTQPDLLLLPQITGDLRVAFREWLTLDQPIFLPLYGVTATPVLGALSSFLPTFVGLTLDAFPLGEQPDTLALRLDSGDAYIMLGRDVGPLLYIFLSILETAQIVGTCGGSRPVIALQPRGGLVEVGEPYTFHVEALGKESPEYWWRKDGVSLPAGFNSAYLAIDSVSEEDGGSYACLLVGDNGTTMSDAAYLQVVPEGSLPAGGIGALAVAGALLAAMACRHLRRTLFSHSELQST